MQGWRGGGIGVYGDSAAHWWTNWFCWRQTFEGGAKHNDWQSLLTIFSSLFWHISEINGFIKKEKM